MLDHNTSEFPRSIGMPATNALAHIGITQLKQLTDFTEKELLAIHGIGPKAVGILKQLLQENNLELRK